MSDWSSDVCSSDLIGLDPQPPVVVEGEPVGGAEGVARGDGRAVPGSEPGAATARPRCGAADWRKGEGDAVHAGDAHPYHTKAVVPGLVPGTQCPNRPVGGWKKRKRR